MAVVISVEKLVKGLSGIGDIGPIHVKLRNNNTMFKDRVTGWTIKGDEEKELPHISAGHPLSQPLFLAIRSGRFIRVKVITGAKGKKRKKYEELIDSVIKEYDEIYNLVEKGTDIENN